MNVVRAYHAGFCMGVALALHKLDSIVANRSVERVATFGEIIHNPQVLEEYAQKGVTCLHSVEEAKADMSVLIRAHGIPRNIEENLRRRCKRVEDATCPKVQKAQIAIAKATASGRKLLLYGEAMHPEVQGLISYAAGESRIFSSLAELDAMFIRAPHEREHVVLAAQTTQDRQIFDEMHRRLAECMDSSLVVLDTICDATRQRQEEAWEIAAHVQVMVVVGGKNSGNTRRLAELSRMRGVPALLVETAEELNAADFSGVRMVGLTAGASTPKSIIDKVEKRLRSMA